MDGGGHDSRCYDTTTTTSCYPHLASATIAMPHNSPRAAQRAARANTIKSELLTMLGNRCAHCGSTHDLEVNHIHPRTWTPRHLTHYRRVLRYRREAAAGLLNLLCSDCNSRYRPIPLPTTETVATAAGACSQQPF